jgi:hypothetical protein
MKHIEAIEAILNKGGAGTGSSDRAAGTTGTSGANASRTTSGSPSGSLSEAQIQQLRTHIAELRKLLAQR